MALKESFSEWINDIGDKALYSRLLKISDRGFKLGQEFNHGTFGKIYHLKDIYGRKQQTVLKIVDLRKFNSSERKKYADLCAKECETMEALHWCPNSAKLLDSEVFYTEDIDALADGRDFNKKERLIFFLFEPLYSTFERNTVLDQEDVVRLGIDICTALQELYERDRIHRDVRPPNLFFTEHSGKKVYLLGDFGIIKIINGQSNTHGLGEGKYYPPEWRQGNMVKNGDLYSLSLCMVRFLGGDWESNFNGVTQLKLENSKGQNLACPALENILKNGLLEHTRRYQQPKDMQADLKLLLAYIEKHGSVPAHMTLEEMKQSHGSGPVRDLVKLAKEALEKRDFQGAATLCREGDPDRDPRLAALLAYSNLHLLHKGLLQEGQRATIEQMLRNGCSQTELVAIGESDPAGKKRLKTRSGAMKCILAVSRYETGHTEEFLQLLESAARFGSPMACYILGRGLFTGDIPFQKDEEKGLSLLQKATADGYSAAERFLHSGGSDARHTMSDILREL